VDTSSTVVVLGNRRCLRCTAKSKRSGQQCRNGAVRGSGKTTGRGVCRMHGGLSTGARTEAGKQRSTAAHRTHGRETRKKRAEYSKGARKLYELEMLGRKIGLISGPIVGRKLTGKS
jgi:hypothetical protein